MRITDGEGMYTVSGHTTVYDDGYIKLFYPNGTSKWGLKILQPGCTLDGESVENGYTISWVYTSSVSYSLICPAST